MILVTGAVGRLGGRIVKLLMKRNMYRATCRWARTIQ